MASTRPEPATSVPTRSAEDTPHRAARGLTFPDNRLLLDLCGQFDGNLALVEDALGIRIARRGNELTLAGPADAQETAAAVLQALYARLEAGHGIEPADVASALRFGAGGTGEATPAGRLEMFRAGDLEIRTRRKTVAPRSPAQAAYLRRLFENELVFGIGPAGTGKTYLAVAVAVSMFLEGRVERIILSRPAVEAGERLGFLPGDMKEKVDPYMQPLYDALNDFLPGRQLARLIEDRQIEIAPLAFMRGRTLANAFILLDEAQNATAMQMKMFLTRLGEGARMAVTGDMSQIDLPRGTVSGLIEAERLLGNVPGVGFARFTAKDVVRHPLVARILEAWDGPGQTRD